MAQVKVICACTIYYGQEATGSNVTDAVVRSVYYKYFHPKEALVSNGVLNRAISRAAGKYVPGLDDDVDKEAGLNPIAQ